MSKKRVVSSVGELVGQAKVLHEKSAYRVARQIAGILALLGYIVGILMMLFGGWTMLQGGVDISLGGMSVFGGVVVIAMAHLQRALMDVLFDISDSLLLQRMERQLGAHRGSAVAPGGGVAVGEDVPRFVLDGVDVGGGRQLPPLG